MDIGVSIDPDHVQILILLEAGQNCRTGDTMVATKTERLALLMARLVKLKVASCTIELLVLDDVGLGIAQVSEDVIVEKQTSLVHALLLLPLTAHANHGLKLSQLVHFLLFF